MSAHRAGCVQSDLEDTSMKRMWEADIQGLNDSDATSQDLLLSGLIATAWGGINAGV